jgi:hypothetical protein
MLICRKIVVVLLMSSMTCVAMDGAIDFILQSDSTSSLSHETSLPGLSNSQIFIESKNFQPIEIRGLSRSQTLVKTEITKPKQTDYDIYVSLQFFPIENEMMGAIKEKVKEKEIGLPKCKIIPNPHVTLYDGTVPLSAKKAKKLEQELQNLSNQQQEDIINVNNAEIGGMCGSSSYFIAYNLNDPDLCFRGMAQNIRDLVKVAPKTYGNYYETMLANGFGGVFQHNLADTDETGFLHLSLLKAYDTKPEHPVYGKEWNQKGNVKRRVGCIINSINAVLTRCPQQKVSEEISHQDIIIHLLTHIISLNEREGTQKRIKDVANIRNELIDSLGQYVSSLSQKSLRIIVNGFYSQLQDVELVGNEKLQSMFLGYIDDNNIFNDDFSEDNKKDNWIHPVSDPQEIKRYNKKADKLCQFLQNQSINKTLELKVKKWEFHVRSINKETQSDTL